MRSETDLRSALDQLAGSAPTSDEVLAGLDLDRAAHRNRAPVVFLAALATVAAAVGVPQILGQLEDESTTPATSREAETASPWSAWLTFPVPSEMDNRGPTYRPNYQVNFLTKTLGPSSAGCILSAHRNGDFDPATIPASSPTVMINGVTGRVVTSSTARPVLNFPEEYYVGVDAAKRGQGKRQIRLFAPTMKTIAWQPAPSLWALLTCETQIDNGDLSAAYQTDFPKAFAIAKTVTPNPARIQSPFHIGYLPKGLTGDSIVVRPPISSDPRTGHAFVLKVTDGNRQAERVHVEYRTDKISTKKTQAPKPDLMINDIPAWFGGSTPLCPSKSCDPKAALRIEGRGFVVEMGAVDNTVSAAEVLKIARGLTFAPSATDTSTWYDAATAIP